MGIGSKIKRAARKVDSSARGVKDDPFSSNSLKTGASLAIGVPLPVGETRSLFNPLMDLPGFEDTYENAKFYSKFATDQTNKKERAGWESQLGGENSWFEGETWRENEDMVILAGTVIGVVLVCVYASALCSYAVTAGLGLATAKAAKVWPGSGKNGLAATEYPPDTPIGDSGDDNSAFGDSWDLNTPAGRKSWLIAGAAVLGAVALFYTVRYLRK